MKHLQRIVAQIREAWPEVKIVDPRRQRVLPRGDPRAGARTNGVDYVIGLAKNTRLTAAIAAELEQAAGAFEATRQPARVFADFAYRTLETWSRERRVVAKAEHLAKGANPRFVVTSLSVEDERAQPLYEEDYCGRGEMENRIKEQQLHLFADRTSATRCGPTRSGCLLSTSPTCCWRRCGGWAWRARSWPRRSARRSG